MSTKRSVIESPVLGRQVVIDVRLDGRARSQPERLGIEPNRQSEPDFHGTGRAWMGPLKQA
jgi:hypothetical protein